MLIAVLLPVILAMIVFFIGLSQMQLSRGELRVASDAAARTATEAIIRTKDEDYSYKQAEKIVEHHRVSQQALTLQRDAVVYGQGVSHLNAPWEFFPGRKPYNAAQVTVARDPNSPLGSIQLFLPMFGMDEFGVAKSAIASQVDHDIVFVIEAGGSMHAPQRWSGVIAAFEQVQEIVTTLGNRTRVGVVVCHKDPYEAQELLQVSGELSDRIDAVHEGIKNVKLSQGRNLGGGLELASDILEAEKQNRNLIADQTIVFLGNGHHNRGIEPLNVAKIAASRGQVIYCLVFGHNADKDGKMEASALQTGGKFFDIKDHSKLPGILEPIVINPSIVLIR